MTLYIVEFDYHYDGSDIVGVYSTFEKAKDKVRQQYSDTALKYQDKKQWEYSTSSSGSSMWIREMELDA